MVSGRPFRGGFQRNQIFLGFPETFPQDLLPSPELTAADGNKPRNTQMVWSTNVVNSHLLHFNKTQEVRMSDDWTIEHLCSEVQHSKCPVRTFPCVIRNKENTTFKTTFFQFTALYEKWVEFSRFVMHYVSHYTYHAYNNETVTNLQYCSICGLIVRNIKDLQSMITGWRTVLFFNLLSTFRRPHINLFPFPDSGKGI